MFIPSRCFAVLTAFAMLVAAFAPQRAVAQDKPHIRAGSLTIPVFAPIILNILKHKGYDEKNGFVLDIQPYPSISAYYAGLATGEVDTLIGGPTYFQKLRSEGVPIKIIATGATLSDLVILTGNPDIKTLADLKGKKLAADMGSGQFQVLSIYAKSKGIDLRKDITIINANFATARAQLAAGRVDAAMVIEPIATMMMKAGPNLNVIFAANKAWAEMTGHGGWELVYAMREDSIKKVPTMPQKFLAALKDVATLINQHVDEADKIASETTKLPPGILKQAVEANRWEFDPKPAWGEQRQAIWDMFERAVKAGYYAKLPEPAIIYSP